MENATKALLIAAAILIAIVLITIGVFVLGQGRDAMSSVDMSEAQIMAFNSKFESYSGQKRGSDVKSLVDRVNMSNKNYHNGDEGALITITGTAVNDTDGITGSNAINSKYDASKIATASWYTISMVKDDNNSLIKTITINK